MFSKPSKFSQYLMGGTATGMALAFGMAGPVYAQEAEPVAAATEIADDDEAVLGVVRVTGIRGSIADSLATKRNATSIVEAISAEDIGKLPDLSIADSLARLPGVTAQRVRGRSQQISIRGLGPDFSIALLNGREVVSSGNNRGIEFDQFPSELISQGIVYKTPDAALAATGIAGAVDLRTVRPLDYTDRRINLSGKYVLNDNDQLNPDFDEDGYRLFASLIDQNEAGTIGWSLAATVQSNPTQFTQRELKTNQFQTSVDPAKGLVYPSDNPRFGVQSREFERTSIAGALQFEPDNRFQATIDGFYTDTEDSGIFRGVETPIASWSGAQFIGTAGTDGFASSARYENVVPIVRTDTEGNTAEIYQIGLNTSYELTDRLTVTGDISRSELDRSDIDYESYAGTGRARSGPQDTLVFQMPDTGEFGVEQDLDYTDPGTIFLTDPGGWGQVGFIKEPEIEDELTQLRLEAEYAIDEVPFISGIKGGLLTTDREKSFDSNEAFLRPSALFTDSTLAIPTDAIIGASDSGSIGFDVIAYDPSSFLGDGTYLVEKATFDVEWVVSEEVYTYYLMADIDDQIGGTPVRGNIGFQFIDTEQSSTGTLNFGTQQTLQTIVDDQEHFLPSANLSFEVADNTFIRVAAAQTLTRPRLDQLAANQSLTFSPAVCPDTDANQLPDAILVNPQPGATCFNVGGGNPFLEPYESTSFDIAFERYFDDTTAVLVALFHKDLSNWVVDRSVLIDGTQIVEAGGLGDLLDDQPNAALTQLNGPVNFADGSISGIEATLRLSFDQFLPENLEGFGFNASYTYADNELEDENGNTLPIPGYSDTVWSGDVYYENYGFRGRVSARYRSGFLSEVQNFDGSLSGADALEETIVDAQIGYEWESGPLEGFSVNLEIFNLTNEPFVTENQTTVPSVVFPSRFEEYGTTYNFTVAKSF
ncbi:MAG: TonB-dependent receptor [Pseudomonadota bacterium]